MSEFEEYKKLGEPDKREKSEIWETAIGLQQVDGLKTSSYLYEIAKINIECELSFYEAKNLINSYYESRSEPSFNFIPSSLILKDFLNLQVLSEIMILM